MPRTKPRSAKRQPMQPIVWAKDGCIRFRENKIVSALLDFATPRGMSLNEITVREDFSREDYNQLMQLLGYSVSGFGDLSTSFKDDVAEADEIADAMLEAHEPKFGIR